MWLPYLIESEDNQSLVQQGGVVEGALPETLEPVGSILGTGIYCGLS